MDWAALAQQWIKMKETIVPPAPPPPTINTMCPGNDGSGEAPMDMDTKDDDVPPAPPAPNISGSGNRIIHVTIKYVYDILCTLYDIIIVLLIIFCVNIDRSLEPMEPMG